MITGSVVAGLVADSIGINAGRVYMSTAVAVAGGALVIPGRTPKTAE